MKLTTKALLSSLTAALVNATPSSYQVVSQRRKRRYEKILEKQDRKGELRAAVLGVESIDFRSQGRKLSLGELVRTYGFSDEGAFYGAVAAKIHDELRRRGWTLKRIQRYEKMRLGRVM